MLIAKQKLIVLKSVDSTNNYAMALVQDSAVKNGDAVFALEQSAGKGTRGKHWISKKGENIIVSVVVQMQWLPIPQQFELSICTALACLEFFSKYIDTNVKIKWPNDIFINDRKAGGVLIENIIRGNIWQWAIIGIGLNINQIEFDNGSLKATSIRKITGLRYNVTELCKELHEIVLNKINDLRSGNFNKMLAKYNENLYCLNQPARLKKESIIFETTIRSVASTGELVTNDSVERKFSFGEIEWIIE